MKEKSSTASSEPKEERGGFQSLSELTSLIIKGHSLGLYMWSHWQKTVEERERNSSH